MGAFAEHWQSRGGSPVAAMRPLCSPEKSMLEFFPTIWLSLSRSGDGIKAIVRAVGGPLHKRKFLGGQSYLNSWDRLSETLNDGGNIRYHPQIVSC
jgi:hypothetical protein